MRNDAKSIMRAAGLAALLCCGAAQAALVTYSTQSSFSIATAGLGGQHLSNFDRTAVGTAFADGTGPAGSNFTLSSTTAVAANTPSVQNRFWTTSGTRYLGLDNADAQFSNGDTLSFALSGSVRAFGLYVIAATNDIQAGDLVLSVGGVSLLNGTADRIDSASGSSAFFFGFVSDADITSAVLNFGTPGDPVFLFNAAVDDVTLFDKAGIIPPIDPGTVPEPTGLALLGLAGVALTVARLSGSRRKVAQPASLARQP